MKTPLIFDIRRTSAADGPGIRTVVFFKGCNLDCFWCHNPEGKAPHAESAYFKEKCIGCGACHKVCARTKEDCVACGTCAAVCPVGAKQCYGRQYTVEELFETIRKDRAFYDATGGGVTFSGGECMLYPEYLTRLAKRCKSDGISVAIDTAGCVPYENFEKILPYADLFLYDVKALDPDLHRAGTGRDNTLILDNLERLIKARADVIIRTPVIPHYNDAQEIVKIQAYCRQRGLPLELLAYHPLGKPKKDALQN